MVSGIINSVANTGRIDYAQSTANKELGSEPKKNKPQIEEPSNRQDISYKEVESLLVDGINLVTGSSQLKFKLEPGSPPVIQVIDRETEKVIKEIPPEYLRPGSLFEDKA